MIYFLYGGDSYRSKEKRDSIIAGYRKANAGADATYRDAKETPFEVFLQQFFTQGIFAKKKLVVLSGIFENKVFGESLLEQIARLVAADDILVICETEADQRTKLFKTLVKEVKSQEFAPLSLLQMKQWTVAEFAKYDAKVEPAALDALVQATQNDLWRASNEIKKLAFLKKGSAVTQSDVAENVAASVQAEIFKTIDALGRNDKREAAALLRRHLEAGDHPLYLLTMIAYQFRNFLIVKELVEKNVPYGAIAKKSGLNPFVAAKSLEMSRRFSLVQLQKIYRDIFKIDADIKTGKIDAEVALDVLLAGL